MKQFFPFVCPKCFQQHETEREIPAVPEYVTITCPFCKTTLKVNGSISILPKGTPFKIDQRYII